MTSTIEQPGRILMDLDLNRRFKAGSEISTGRYNSCEGLLWGGKTVLHDHRGYELVIDFPLLDVFTMHVPPLYRRRPRTLSRSRGQRDGEGRIPYTFTQASM